MTEDQKHTHQGGCYCGSVRYEISSDPQFTMVCHCSICRRLQSSAMGAPATFFPVDGVKVTKGQEHLTEFLSPRRYSRAFCNKCGTRL